MTRAGAHIRSLDLLARAAHDAWTQHARISGSGCAASTPADLAECFKNRYLCFTHAVYLEAALFALRSGVGSRGSSIALSGSGERVHEKLDDTWRIVPENAGFRNKVLETVVGEDGSVESGWVDRRPIPETNAWFETAWAEYRAGGIYD